MAEQGTGAGTGAEASVVKAGEGGENLQASAVQDMISDYLPAKGEEVADVKTEGEKAAGEGEPAAKEGEEKAESAVEEPEAKPEAGADVKALMDQVKALQDKIDTLAKPKEVPKEEKPLITKYFSEQKDFEAAFEKPEALEAVLNKVKMDARTEAVEEVVKNLPQVVTNLVRTHVTVMKSVDNFYAKNPDLNNKRDFVSSVANELMGKNPGWSLNKLFNEELGKEVNKRLGVKPGGGQPPKAPGQPPKPRGGRAPVGKEPDIAPLQKEILDLI